MGVAFFSGERPDVRVPHGRVATGASCPNVSCSMCWVPKARAARHLDQVKGGFRIARLFCGEHSLEQRHVPASDVHELVELFCCSKHGLHKASAWFRVASGSKQRRTTSSQRQQLSSNEPQQTTRAIGCMVLSLLMVSSSCRLVVHNSNWQRRAWTGSCK